MSIDVSKYSDDELEQLHRDILDVMNGRARAEIAARYAAFEPYYAKCGNHYLYAYSASMISGSMYIKVISVIIEQLPVYGTSDVEIHMECTNASRLMFYDRIEKSEFVAKFGDAINEFNNLMEVCSNGIQSHIG